MSPFFASTHQAGGYVRMISKRLEDIEEADLQALIDNAVPEDRQLEYKRELHGGSNEQRKEFCYDFSAFANAIGGDILFGIEEDQTTHVPSSMPGVDGNAAEQNIRAMETRLINGVSPRMTASFRAVPLANGNVVIVARIPQSINPPHMTVIDGAYRFIVRDGSGKHTMDVQELRTMFIEESTRLDRMRQFVDERVAMIAANSSDLPVPITTPHKLVVHYLPLQSFSTSSRLDIADLRTANSVFQAQPFPDTAVVTRPNIDGFVYPATPAHLAQQREYYAQVFHNGTLELVSGNALFTTQQPPRLYPASLEAILFQGANWAERIYRRAQFMPPVYVFVTLLGARDYTIEMAVDLHRGTTGTPTQLNRDVIRFPSLVMDTLEADPPAVFKPMIDQLWNGLGFSSALTYGGDGAYLGIWHNVLPPP